MSDKYYKIEIDDIKAIQEAVEVLRSADFNDIHANLEILSGMNSTNVGEKIAIGDLVKSVNALQGQIYDRHQSVLSEIKNGNKSATLTHYEAQLDQAITNMGKTASRMLNHNLSKTSTRKIDAGDLFNSVRQSMNSQFARLSKPSYQGGSVENPNKQVQMFLEKSTSKIADYIGKAFFNDSSSYTRSASKDSFSGTFDELYKAIGSGNFTDLKKISGLKGNNDYIKMAQSIVKQIESGLGADASAFKKDMAVTHAARSLGIKNVVDFNKAFSNAALNGGEKIASEVRRNVENFLTDNLASSMSEVKFQQMMGEISGLFNFADGDAASRDRVIKQASDIADRYVPKAVKDMFSKVPELSGKGSRASKPLLTDKTRSAAIDSAINMVKSSVVGVNDSIGHTQNFANNEWFNGKALQKRYEMLNKTSRGKGKSGYNTKSFAADSLRKIQETAAQQGMSVVPSLSPDGSSLHLGFVRKGQESQVISKNGSIDFSKTAGHVMIPTGNSGGSMKVNGMSKADFFTSIIDPNNNKIVGTTLSDANFREFAESFTKIRNMQDMSPRELTSRLGRVFRDIYGDTTGLNQYVDSDEMLKGTTLGDNKAANLNKSSGYDSNPLIKALKSNQHFKRAASGIEESELNGVLHDLITSASSGSDADYEDFIRSNSWLQNLYGNEKAPGDARSLLQNLRKGLRPYGLTSSDRRDDPYNAGIYSTSASHIFKPFMKEYGSGAGGRYGEQSIKDIERTNSAKTEFNKKLGQFGLSKNMIKDGLANELGVSYRDEQLYNMLEATDEELWKAHTALGRKGSAPSVFGGGLAVRSNLYSTLESHRAIPTSVTAQDLFDSDLTELFSEKDLVQLRQMGDGDYFTNPIVNSLLGKNYRVGNSLLKAGSSIRGIKYSNGQYILDTTETLSAGESEKYLSGIGLRGTLAPGDAGIDEEFVQQILRNRGMTEDQIKQLAPQISGFMSAEDLSKGKYQAGKVLAKAQYALNGALSEGMTEQEFSQRMQEMSDNGGVLGKALSSYFKYQNGNIITDSSKSFTEILNEITGGDAGQIRQAEQMLFTNDTSLTGSLSDLLYNFVGANSPLALGIKAGMLSTSLNKADTATYNDVSALEKYSRVKAGARERDIMRRTGRNIAMGAGSNANAVNAYFSAVDDVFSTGDTEAVDTEIARMKKIAASTMASGTSGQIRGDTYLTNAESSRAIFDPTVLSTEDYNGVFNQRVSGSNGYMLSKEQYDASIFGHMERMRESIYGQGGILDRNSIPMSAKLAGTVDMGEGYGVNELFLSSLPEEIRDQDGNITGYTLSQEQIEFERAVKQSYRDPNGKNVGKLRESIGNVLNAQQSSYMDKNGRLFKLKNEKVQAGGGFLQASAGNVYGSNENAAESNSIEISAKDAKTMLSKMDPQTLGYLKQHLLNKVTQSGGTLKGTGENGELTLDDIVNYYADNNASDYLIGEAKRFPLKGDNTISPTRIRVNKNMDAGVMRMHSGIAANLKADFDGDLPALTLAAYRKSYGSQSEFDEVMAGGRASIEALDPIVQAVGRYNSVKGNEVKTAEQYAEEAQKYVDSLSSTEDREALGSFSKKLKTSLGLHSAAFSGQNYVADSLTTAGTESQMRQILLNSVFSSIEQDMLSNKKLEEIAGQKDGTSLATNARLQSENLSKINKALYNKDTSIDDMVKMWTDAGFIGDEGISNQFTLDALLKVSNLFGDKGKAFLSQLGINPDNIYNEGDVEQSKPLITSDQFKSLYEAQFGSREFGKHSSAYREAIGKTVTNDGAIRNAMFGANIYGVGSGDSAKTVEQSTNAIAALSAILAKLTGDANVSADALSQLSSNMLGLQHVGDIKATSYYNGGMSVTELSNRVFGNEYVPDATQTAIDNQIDTWMAAATGVDKYGRPTGVNPEDNIEGITNEYAKLINMQNAQGNRWNSYRDAIQTTRFGTMQHAGIEALIGSQADLNAMANADEIKTFLSNRKIGLNSLEDLFNFVNQNVGDDAPAGLRDFQSKVRARTDSYRASEAAYRTVMSEGLGFKPETIEESLQRVHDVTSRFSQALSDMGLDAVAVEEQLAASIDGQNVRGRADVIARKRGTGEEVIIDAKNTDRVSDTAVAQTGIYSSITNQLRKELVDDVLGLTGKSSKHDVTDAELEQALGMILGKGDLEQYKGMSAARLKSLFRTDTTSSGVAQIDSNEAFKFYANTIGGPEFAAMVSKAMAGKLTEEDVAKNKKFLNTKAALADIYALAGVENPYAANAEKEKYIKAQEQEKAQQRAMQSSLGGYKNYNTAELNMIRAQKALEKARASGNAEAIYGAEQQLEGARQAAEVAGQYKGQFALYDKNGKQLNITNDKGQYLSDAEIRKQAGGEYTGAFSYYNQETGQMDTKAFSGYKEAHDYLNKMTILQGKHMQAVGKTNAQVKTMGSLIGEVLGGMKQTVQYLMRTSIVYAAIGKVKQAFATLIQTTQALNKSYVDLRIASGQTDSQMKDSMKIYNQMAKEMGKTTQEVAAAANDWLRAGYNAEESAKLIKNSMQLSTVGMIDSAKATEYLISTMKGWKLGVNDMEGVVDKLAELDRNEINNMAYCGNSKSYPLNCWEILKLDKLQRNNEIYVNVICDESRKNYQDDTRLKPKCYYNRCSAAKLRTEESSTINRLVSGVGMKANVIPKRWASERAMI